MATIRDNDVYVTVPSGYQLKSGSFKVLNGSVTNGQPSDVKAGSILTCTTDGKFRFRVGRKGSAAVANWFNSQIDAVTNTTFGHTAGSLNFAFIGRLELLLIKDNQNITYCFDNVVFAQGSSGTSNNWWFGGKTAKYIKNDRAILDGYNNNQQKVALTCSRGGNSVNKVDILQVFNQLSWMSKLKKTLSLKQINMVGTHDTGTYYASGVEKPWVKTQSLTTTEQLRAGVRYLDVRCHHISDMFTIHHADWYMNLYFRDLLEDCMSFLKSNPSETLVMQVKEEHGDADKETNTRSFAQTLQVYIDRYPGMWFLGSDIPTLEQAQGKVVLVSRVNGTKGIRVDFEDNKTFTSGKLKIQDQYNFTSVDNKWNAVQALLTESSQNNQGQWFINFTSAASSNVSAITNTPEVIAKNMNNKLVSAIAKYKFVGTVVMDFPETPSLTMTIDKIIDKNFTNPMFS